MLCNVLTKLVLKFHRNWMYQFLAVAARAVKKLLNSSIKPSVPL